MAKRMRITFDFNLENAKCSEEELAGSLLFNQNDDVTMSLIDVEPDIKSFDVLPAHVGLLDFKVEVYDDQTGEVTYKDISAAFDENFVLKLKNNNESKEMEEMRDEAWHNRNCL